MAGERDDVTVREEEETTAAEEEEDPSVHGEADEVDSSETDTDRARHLG